MNKPLTLFAGLLGSLLFCMRSRRGIGRRGHERAGGSHSDRHRAVQFAGGRRRSFDVAQLVSDDLARSGRFKIMDRKDMIEQPHTGAAISFDDWRRLNNDYIVVGQVQPLAADRFNISFELYNVLTRQRLLGYQISANKPGLRLASHQVADMIFEKILGHPRCVRNPHRLHFRARGSCRNKTYQLIVADADGENPHVVMQSNEPLMSPSWSPDGQSLAYVSFEARLPTVYVQLLKTGDRQRVSAQGGSESGAGVVAGRQEAGADALDAGRQLGYLCNGHRPRRR